MPEKVRQGWSIKDQFAECRLRGHHWKRRRSGNWLILTADGYLVWNYDCEDCGTEKKVPYHYRSGRIRHALYSHVDGYLLELKGQRRPNRAELRLECLKTIIGDRDVTAEAKKGAA